MPKPSKKQIEAMEKLGFSKEEIEDIIKTDEAIDKGEKVYFDLPPEKEKEAKKFTKAGTRKGPTVYKLDNKDGKRSRKENPTKAAIIAELAKFLTETSENACEMVEITNKERQIAFKIGENAYELTLVQKRKPKTSHYSPQRTNICLPNLMPSISSSAQRPFRNISPNRNCPS